jgi:hypothetical protein
MEALREGRSGAVLAGGATSVEQEFLDALCRAGRLDGGQPRCGACLLLLEAQVPAGEAGPLRSGAGNVLGYGEGFGGNDIRDAVQACLEDARLLPEQIGSVRVASLGDYRRLVESLRQARVKASAVRSPSSEMYSASFPMVVAEVAGQAANGAPQPVLVVGRTACGRGGRHRQCGDESLPHPSVPRGEEGGGYS